MKKSMQRVCLFGLSADPPTGKGGHASIVEYLSSLKSSLDETKLEFDEVRVLPVYRHMFASKRGKQATYDDRLELCRLAFADIPNVVVSDDERRCFQLKREASGITTEEDLTNLRVGTADILDMLMEENKSSIYTFALGQDTFLDLTAWKWRRSKDIIEMLEGRLIIFRRKVQLKNDEEANTDAKEDQLQQRVDGLCKEMEDSCPMLKGNIRIADGTFLTAISSSLVRSSNDEHLLSQNLHPRVLDFIKKNHMYSYSIG